MQRVCVFDSGTVRHDIFDPDDLPPVLTQLRSEYADVQVLPEAVSTAPPQLVVMDMDSTVINEEVIDLLAAHAGIESQVATITARAMAGDIDFVTSLSQRVALLAGLPESALAEVAAQVTYTPGVERWVAALSNLDCEVVVISGGFLEIVEPVTQALGVHRAFANRLEISGGTLTGRLVGPVVGRAFKAEKLTELADQLGAHRTLAIGDGANDVDMIHAAACGVAFDAKDVLTREADLVLTYRHMNQLTELFCAPYVSG